MTDNMGRMKLEMADGRALGYAEYGCLEGKAVLVFPGTPSSRLMHPPQETSKALGCRVIVVERPGFGLSDFQAGRTLLDWPADVLSFADGLELGHFAVVGISGGGPYAAVCALFLLGAHPLCITAPISSVLASTANKLYSRPPKAPRWRGP